jgi:hypothetical protein
MEAEGQQKQREPLAQAQILGGEGKLLLGGARDYGIEHPGPHVGEQTCGHQVKSAAPFVKVHSKTHQRANNEQSVSIKIGGSQNNYQGV